jgi:hypothetical protein
MKKEGEFHPHLGALPSRERKIKDRFALGKKNWWMTDGSSTNSMLKERLFPNPLPFLTGGRRMERREPKTIRRFANLKHDPCC